MIGASGNGRGGPFVGWSAAGGSPRASLLLTLALVTIVSLVAAGDASHRAPAPAAGRLAASDQGRAWAPTAAPLPPTAVAAAPPAIATAAAPPTAAPEPTAATAPAAPRAGQAAEPTPAAAAAQPAADPPAVANDYFLGGAAGCKRVGLIFNVGVGEEPASGILDTLAAENVPATMFVMGWWADENPPILQRMANEGYVIGSHGYASQELTQRPDAEIAADVQKAERSIEAAIGRPIDRYFTPFAAATDARVQALVAAEGYLNVGWEVAAADYGPEATEESVYERVMAEVHDGALVELHLDGPASAESTGRALPRIIEDLRAEGYRFVTVPQMREPCAAPAG